MTHWAFQPGSSQRRRRHIKLHVFAECEWLQTVLETAIEERWRTEHRNSDLYHSILQLPTPTQTRTHTHTKHMTHSRSGMFLKKFVLCRNVRNVFWAPERPPAVESG